MIHYLMIFAGRIVVHASDVGTLAALLNRLDLDPRRLNFEERVDGIYVEGIL